MKKSSRRRAEGRCQQFLLQETCWIYSQIRLRRIHAYNEQNIVEFLVPNEPLFYECLHL